MQRRLGAVISAMLLAFLALSANAAKFSEATGPDLPPGDGRSSALLAGPYVQNITTTSATIMWQTGAPSKAELRITGGGESHSYATTKARQLSEVRVTGLTPGTTYKYTLSRAGKSVGWKFNTFPVKERPVRFAVYGDSRTGTERHRRVIEGMSREMPLDFVLHTGDVVNRGSDLSEWIPQFFDPAAKLIHSVPFYVAIGNHEGNSDYFFRYFSLPMSERWYSFDVLGIHVIALDSSTDFDVGSAQYNWLVSDLESHKSAAWKFIFMHHPTYSSGLHGGVDANGVPSERPTAIARRIFPGLASKYGIAMIFAGHDHAYERSVQDGVQYIVAGGGGAPSYGEPYAKYNHYRQVFYSGLHYCYLNVTHNKAWMVVKTPSGKVIDRLEMTRKSEAQRARE